MQNKKAALQRIQEVHDFDARRAAKELLKFGFTAVDDIGGLLIESAEDELLDELGLAVDALDFTRDEIDTSYGPVFVFRDTSQVTLEAAKKLVFSQYPPLPE